MMDAALSPARTRPRTAIALIALLTLLAVLRSMLGTQLDSFTADEPWHIVAGTSYVRTGDHRLNPEHPPLAKLWVGAWMPRTFHVPPLPALHEKSAEREFVESTMYLHNDDRAAQTRARAAMWTLQGLLLFAGGLLLWRAFGLPWAVGTLAWLALDPTVGAHLPVVMTDLPVALTLALAALSLGLLLSTWRWRWALALGVGIGLALGSKHSALAALAGLAVFAAIVVLWQSRRDGVRVSLRRFAMLAASAVLGLALLWAQYGLHFHANRDGRDLFNLPMAEKIDALQIPHWRALVLHADAWHLLPRAYLWGLADTVRAGVEGRGQSEYFVWGHLYSGEPPWFLWPSVVISKVPLAALALSLFGVYALFRLRLTVTARWCLASCSLMAATHFAALLSSHGTYGGVRHALPLVWWLALVAGAGVAFAWQRIPAGGGASMSRLRAISPAWGVAALFVAAIGMTIREPRLWEYHNELAGGSRDAWRNFSNEGLDLGQRFHELHAFNDRVMARSGLPIYYDYWLIRDQARAAHIPLRRRVEDLHDNNVQGIYDGWFVIPVAERMPWPSADWDPKIGLKGLHPVARFGVMEIWRGHQVLPLARADSLTWKVNKYIYEQGGQDWPLVAQRCEEIVAISPQNVSAGVELGNAYLRMGRGKDAQRAYNGLLVQTRRPVDALTRQALLAQIASIDDDKSLKSTKPMRNPWTE